MPNLDFEFKLELVEQKKTWLNQSRHLKVFVLKCVAILGIGMDASVTPLRHSGLSLVQTTDFFYPLVDDPYMQGNIALKWT